jgi:hypothetical protein
LGHLKLNPPDIPLPLCLLQTKSQKTGEMLAVQGRGMDQNFDRYPTDGGSLGTLHPYCTSKSYDSLILRKEPLAEFLQEFLGPLEKDL